MALTVDLELDRSHRLTYSKSLSDTLLSSIQTNVTFRDQDISKCLTNLFLVIEWINRISLASFSGV